MSYHHSNAMFKMPDDPNVPILMVSAGSGIAPFRSFWQQRMLLHWPRSTAWLYHGCRNRSENMFEDETSKIVQRHVAMSRVGDTKQYVQDLLLRDQTFANREELDEHKKVHLCCSQCPELEPLRDKTNFAGHMEIHFCQLSKQFDSRKELDEHKKCLKVRQKLGTRENLKI